MVSRVSLGFFINAALEIVAVVFMIIILMSSLFRKKKTATCIPFCLFTLDMTLLLICNLTSWILDGLNLSNVKNHGFYIFSNVLLVFDFFFYILASVMFYNYITTLINGIDKNYKKPGKATIHLLVVNCVITAAIFSFAINKGWFYCVGDDGYTHYTFAYWILIICSIPSIWISYATILKNRKLLGKYKTLLLLSYLIVPMIFIVVDQTYSLVISYLGLALVTSVIYVSIDMELDKELLEQEAVISRNEAENTQMRLNLMMSQIQPHFLYNTLSTISYLCRTDPKGAEIAVNDFSEYLAGNLRSINANKPIYFETELRHIKTYFKIQKRRFLKQIFIRYDIETTDFHIPALTLQPIVENIFNNISDIKSEAINVLISTTETDEEYVISVKHDVVKDENSKENCVGIENVKSRLKIMMNGRLEIKTDESNETTVTIYIPKQS